MTIQLHTIVDHADYRLKLYNLLVKVEFLVRTAYLVPNHTTKILEPHIGIGFLITKNPGLTAVIRAFGINPNNDALTPIQRARESYYADLITQTVQESFANKGALQQALNAIMDARFKENSVYGDFVRQEKFEFNPANDDAQVKGAYNEIIGIYELRVRNWFGSAAFDTDSNERIALVSMAYQGFINTGKSQLLKRAIINNDRAEAWYEIRYNTSQEARRFLEADTFGLYEPGYGLTMRDVDAKGALRTYTRHQAKMDAFEAANQSKLATAVIWGNQLGIPVYNLTDHLEPARLYLINKYVDQPGYGISIFGEVYVGENDGTDGGLDTRYYKGTDADLLIGSDKNDLIFGDSGADYLIGFGGDDVIYGGSGDDRIIGGLGSDVLLGGAGNDTYYVGGFDPGQDRIEDKEGNNTVIFNDIALKYFVKEFDKPYWQDLDRRFKAEMQGTDLKVTDTQVGNSVILNENFQSGDFGIRLIDLPAEPTEDTATGPSGFWGSAPPNVAVSSTKTITTTTTVSKNGVTTTTQSPDPLPPTVTDNEILFKSEQVSNTTVTTGQGTPETTDDTSTTVIVDNWYYRGPQAQMIDGDSGNSFSADAVTTLMDGQGGNDAIDGRGVNGITLLGGAGDDTLKNGYLIRGGDGNDFIDGYGGPGFYYGEAGNDFIYYYYTDPAGNSVADGGSGSDLIFGENTGDNHFIGGDNDDPLDEGDLIISVFGNDFLEGGNGNDILFDYLGADVLYGGAGDDYLFGNASAGYVERYVWSIVTPVTDIIAGVQFDGSNYEFPPFEFTGIYFTDYDPKASDNLGDVILGGAGKVFHQRHTSLSIDRYPQAA